MAAAGYAHGVKAMLNLTNAPAGIRIGEVIAEQLRKSLGIDFTIEAVDRATTVDRTIRGTHHASLDSSGVILLDPADYLNQHFLVMGGQKNPDSWSHPRLTELIEAQARESELTKRLSLFKEAVHILRQGESHVVPLTWRHSGGIMDYRLQNFHVPGSEQIVKHFEHLWWDPNAPLPSEYARLRSVRELAVECAPWRPGHVPAVQDLGPGAVKGPYAGGHCTGMR